MNKKIRGGEIWWVRLGAGPDVQQSGKIKKERPAVVVSNNPSNTHLNRIQVIPLSSQITKIYPSEALVQVKGVLNKAMADQIMTANKDRLTNKIGKASKKELLAIESALRIQLALT